MDRKLFFALFLLPGLAQAVICRNVGPDGVASFTNVPGDECPSGERVEAYVPPAPTAERAERLVTGAPGSEAEFAGYESITIESPEEGATIRNNAGRVSVVVALEPGLQQFHFITAYLDGMAHQGNYGSSMVELTDVARGTHWLYVTVKDSKGKTLIKSGEISFTLQRISPELTVNPITGDDHVDARDPGYVRIFGCYQCGESTEYESWDRDKTRRHQDPDKEGRYKDRDWEFTAGPWVTLWFPVRNLESRLVRVRPVTKTVERVINTSQGPRKVVETYNWVIKVPRAWLQTEASFEVRVRNIPKMYENTPIGDIPLATIPIAVKTTSTHSVDPELWRPLPADYTTSPGETNRTYPGVPTTPGKTNPAYPGVPTTPGQINPAYPGISTTPGKTNPAFTR